MGSQIQFSLWDHIGYGLYKADYEDGANQGRVDLDTVVEEGVDSVPSPQPKGWLSINNRLRLISIIEVPLSIIRSAIYSVANAALMIYYFGALFIFVPLRCFAVITGNVTWDKEYKKRIKQCTQDMGNHLNTILQFPITIIGNAVGIIGPTIGKNVRTDSFIALKRINNSYPELTRGRSEAWRGREADQGPFYYARRRSAEEAGRAAADSAERLWKEQGR